MAEFPVRAVIDDQGVDLLIKQLTRAGHQAGLSEKQIKEMNDEIRKTGREGSKEVNNLNNQFNNLVNGGLKKAGTALVGYFAVERLFAFTQGVIKVTSEFQKFAAVLENTLGSRSQAQIALSQITKFASQTPFSVQELTSSFVKLANQGFVPAGEEMRKLGDLAASQGKEFIMLTEAIIDAQTGEFERLKEFGIRASKQGDQVIFTFKGVKTQVDFTSESIRNYIVGLGDAAGVSGSMAAISGTLGGQISNLEDSWDSFLNTLGQGNSGALKETISLLAQALEYAKELVTTEEQRFNQLISDTQRKAVDTFKDYVKGYEDVNVAREAYFKDNDKKIDQLQAEFSALADAGEKQVTLKDRILGNVQAIDLENKARLDKMRALDQEMQALEEAEKAIDDYIDTLEKAKKAEEPKAKLGLIESIEKQLKALNDLKEKATTFDEIERLNDQIFTLTRRLNQLKNAGQDLASPFDDKVLKKFSDGIAKDTDKQVKRAHENAERMMKDFTEKYKAELKKREEAEKTHEDAKREIREAGFDAASTLTNAIFEINMSRSAAEFENLQEQKARELELAGDNSEARERIMLQFDKKERRLRREQARLERENALFQIAINTAASISRVSPNPVLMALAAVIGVAQASVVASRPLPKYAKGKYQLDGPGTETSDSIPALLSKGESVVSADKSRKYGYFLEPLIAGREDEALSNMALQLKHRLTKATNHGGADSFLNGMKETMQEIRNLKHHLKQVHVNIDEEGFKKWVVDGHRKSINVNSRYRF
jgi:hypothetical protein